MNENSHRRNGRVGNAYNINFRIFSLLIKLKRKTLPTIITPGSFIKTKILELIKYPIKFFFTKKYKTTTVIAVNGTSYNACPLNEKYIGEKNNNKDAIIPTSLLYKFLPKRYAK
jgi:hypothetical protein